MNKTIARITKALLLSVIFTVSILGSVFVMICAMIGSVKYLLGFAVTIPLFALGLYLQDDLFERRLTMPKHIGVNNSRQ